ncbi:MAG: ribosome-recycling factor [Candidatus Paceibacterota bacterium]
MEQILKEFEINVEKVASDLKTEFISLRGNRPTVKLVEDIKVEVYGERMFLKQLGSISIAPPREISISLWDKSLISAVSKAIEGAIELSPSSDGSLLRINLPPLTEERKKDLIKATSKLAEEARIKIRSLRDTVNKKIVEKEETDSFSEDQKFRYKERAQKIVDEGNKKVESLLEEKVSEIKE